MKEKILKFLFPIPSIIMTSVIFFIFNFGEIDGSPVTMAGAAGWKK